MSYRRILQQADEHFGRVSSTQPGNLQCTRGCTFCCHGLFEISSGDAAVVAEAVLRAAPAKRKRLVERASKIMEATSHPNIREISADEKEEFFDRTSAIQCPALSDRGACTIYDDRPIICRTFGLPIRDGDDYIGDICELNFTDASDEEKLSASWDLQNEDPVSADDQYTIPEAIVMAARLAGARGKR